VIDYSLIVFADKKKTLILQIPSLKNSFPYALMSSLIPLMDCWSEELNEAPQSEEDNKLRDEERRTWEWNE
jgi:hypothetical protein